MKLGQSTEHPVLISGQDTICKAFSKMMFSPLSLAYRLNAQSPNVMWIELKMEFSMQYSAISYDSHATQAFVQLEQGPDELPDMYLHHSSVLLSKIYHTSDMSRISAESLNHLCSGLWPKLQEVEGQCCRTSKHAMENAGRLIWGYLQYWCRV